MDLILRQDSYEAPKRVGHVFPPLPAFLCPSNPFMPSSWLGTMALWNEANYSSLAEYSTTDKCTS